MQLSLIISTLALLASTAMGVAVPAPEAIPDPEARPQDFECAGKTPPRTSVPHVVVNEIYYEANSLN
jgi:hypothetical protein